MLKDSYGRIHNYLRISVTDKCNFRCFYCKPSGGVMWYRKGDILSFDEIIRLAKIFAELGINKVRITGGEPLLRDNVEELVHNLSRIKGIEKIGFTTNGYYLRDKAKVLKESGLKLVNISLDTLREDRFREMSRTSDLKHVLDGIEAAINEGFEKVKINTVVIRGFNDDEILDFVNYAKDRNVHLRFIEFMPFLNNGWGQEKFIPNEKVKKEIERSYRLLPLFDDSNVSANYMISGHKTIIGFISSNSSPFCRDCSRIRLTSDGKMKLCLFENESYNLKDLLQRGSDDVTIKAYIRGCLMMKWSGRTRIAELSSSSGSVMTQIGG